MQICDALKKEGTRLIKTKSAFFEGLGHNFAKGFPTSCRLECEMRVNEKNIMKYIDLEHLFQKQNQPPLNKASGPLSPLFHPCRPLILIPYILPVSMD